MRFKNLLLALFLAGSLITTFDADAQKRKLPYVQPEWQKEYPPFRIAGNLYYVGTSDLSCYLITTTKGHILINTGLEESVPLIRKHVETLGFQFSDIKILLATHAHYDHVAGMAAIKKLTGAQMTIEEKDAPALADGGNSDYILGGKGATFDPVKADRLLRNKDSIILGGMDITILHHPGHTPGASSFLFTVKDKEHAYRVLIANMPSILDETKLSGMPGYPNVGKDYAYTLDAMKKIKFDLWLSSHASQFDLHKKHKPGGSYNPEVFRDQKGYDESLKQLQLVYDKKIGKK